MSDMISRYSSYVAYNKSPPIIISSYHVHHSSQYTMLADRYLMLELRFSEKLPVNLGVRFDNKKIFKKNIMRSAQTMSALLE